MVTWRGNQVGSKLPRQREKGLFGRTRERFIALESDIAYHQLIVGAEPSGLCMDPFDKFKVLMYSHDTFGLGHLRRSRTIAHALVSHFPNVEVSIISGSPVVSAYPFEDRVDYVQIPAAHKLSDGSYVSGSTTSTFDDTISRREALIDEAADRIDPQLVIVDKEPLGLAREMLPALQRLKERGATTVLGLRDVLDAPELLREEWARKHILDHLETLYDEIWIYGPGSFYNPLAGIDLPEAVLSRTRYTGFLPRALPETGVAPNDYGSGYVLVTAGGGGDGYELMAAALNVIKQGLCDHLSFLFVLGPFMTDGQRFEIMARASGVGNVRLVDFDANLEVIVANARAVIGMCGYNTFCEVMSFDKPALFIPRTAPRREQSIRAHRAEEFGWVDVLDIESAKNPHRFLAAINRLLERAPPSTAVARPDMDGLNRICALSEILLDHRTDAATVAATLRAASL